MLAEGLAQVSCHYVIARQGGVLGVESGNGERCNLHTNHSVYAGALSLVTQLGKVEGK